MRLFRVVCASDRQRHTMKTTKNRLSRRALVLGALIASTHAHEASAQDAERKDYALAPTVITAERLELPIDEVGSSVTLITPEQLARTTTVAEALQRTRGISVRSNGGIGTATTVSIRGTQANQTLIMINGVEIRDASVTNAPLNLNALRSQNIERIEVIRGPHSTLYGSSAIGGVINIITKQPSKKDVQGSVDFEAGSYGTHSGSMSVSGSKGDFSYRAFASAFQTEGFSTLDSTQDAAQEKDGFKQVQFNGDLGYRFSDHAEAHAFVQYTQDERQIDVAPNYNDDGTDGEQLVAQLSGTLRFLDEDLTIKPALNLTDTETVNHGSSVNGFLGTTYGADLDAVYQIHPQVTLLGGLEHSQDEARSIRDTNNFNQDRSTSSAYAQARLSYAERLYITLGSRHDDSGNFGSETTWRIAPVLSIHETNTRVHGNYGTGFRAPSLGEQFNTFGGFVTPNPNLTAETSEGFDIGIEQSLFDNKLIGGLTYFYNDISQMISYSLTANQFQNISSVRTQGYEAFVEAELMEGLRLDANYTWLDTLDRNTGVDLGRQPEQSMAADLNWQALPERLNLNLGMLYVGHRFDRGNNVTPLSSYIVWNAAARYRINRSIELFGRIENLFDKDYQEIATYNTADRALYVGARISFD